MKKYLPYQQYDLLAIENWLNSYARKGYRLVKMDGMFPEFKKHYDKLVHYRVRYIPNNTRTDHAFYWGDLYIYESDDPASLPKPSYEKGSVMAAKAQKFPWFVIALAICAIFTLWNVCSNLSVPPLLVVSQAVSTVAQFLWIALIVLDWRRSRGIANGTLNPVKQPPSPVTKRLTTVASLVAIFTVVVTVLAGEALM